MYLYCQLLAFFIRMSSFGVRASSISTFAGPYIAYGEQIHSCSDWTPGKENYAIFNVTRLSHWNPYQPYKLQIMSINITIRGLDVDDKFPILIVLDLWNNNQWKRNALVVKLPGGCSAARTHAPYLFNSVFDIDLNAKGPCLVKKGIYDRQNMPFNYTFPHFPILPYGQYRYRLEIFTPQNEKFTCANLVAHIVPKVASK